MAPSPYTLPVEEKNIRPYRADYWGIGPIGAMMEIFPS